MNPWSDGGKVKRFDLEAEARRHGVTAIVLPRGDDLRALAEQAVDAGADVIGMAGATGHRHWSPTWPGVMTCPSRRPSGTVTQLGRRAAAA
jgi:hypothetical protein